MTEEKKMRYSKQREMIYEYLLSTGEHPSAETIYEDLRKTIPALSLGTVYRNLKVLEELGMIRKISGSGNTERYDSHIDVHSHFLCTECGTLHDISCTDAATVYGAVMLEPGYHATDFSLTLKGLCPKCAEKEKEKEKVQEKEKEKEKVQGEGEGEEKGKGKGTQTI